MWSIRLLARVLAFTFALVSGKLWSLIFLILVKMTFLSLFFFVVGERLNDFVSHFEALDYDINLLENRHQRVRRSFDEDSTLHLDFKAHGRY